MNYYTLDEVANITGISTECFFRYRFATAVDLAKKGR